MVTVDVVEIVTKAVKEDVDNVATNQLLISRQSMVLRSQLLQLYVKLKFQRLSLYPS